MIDVDRFREGDPAYFTDLVRTRGLTVLAVARSFGGDLDHVEELVQQTWIRVFERRRSFRGRGSFEGWLHRIATNVCISDSRARKIRNAASHRMAEEGRGRELSWTALDPLRETERRDLHNRLHRALAQLPDREFEAIHLRILEGRPSQEVAAEMKITKAGVRSIIRSGVNRLKTIMEDLRDELSGPRPSH